MISNSYLTRQNLKGNRYKSGIANFTWKMTWNNATVPYSVEFIHVYLQISS